MQPVSPGLSWRRPQNQCQASLAPPRRIKVRRSTTAQAHRAVACSTSKRQLATPCTPAAAAGRLLSSIPPLSTMHITRNAFHGSPAKIAQAMALTFMWACTAGRMKASSTPAPKELTAAAATSADAVTPRAIEPTLQDTLQPDALQAASVHPTDLQRSQPVTLFAAPAPSATPAEAPGRSVAGPEIELGSRHGTEQVRCAWLQQAQSSCFFSAASVIDYATLLQQGILQLHVLGPN